MDGTLWDATESYARIWNECSASRGLDFTNFTGADLMPCMGKPLADIFETLIGSDNYDDKEGYLKELAEIEDKRMPEYGGKLFDGVEIGIRKLVQYYKVMLVSNCAACGLKNFLLFTKLGDVVCDTLTYGETHLQKSENIQLIMQRNSSSRAIYVGDTQGDCDQTHKANLPFAYMKYGFGNCNNAEFSFNSFDDLVAHLTSE